MAEIIIKEIKHGSSDYKLEIALRNRVLRKPLGLVFDPKALELERDDHHIGVFVGKILLACLVLTPAENGVIKMRQVAVAPEAQGQRVGEAIVRTSETLAIDLGYKKIELSARDTAVGFYLKLGYETEGEEFIEVSIPHRKMFKILA